jgi:hypothetical protein
VVASVGGLVLWRLGPRGWFRTVITTASDHTPDLQIDGSGGLHIVFTREIGGGTRLKYATDRTGSWVVETVATDTSAHLGGARLALTKIGPRVAFVRSDGFSDIVYARRGKAGWRTQLVATVNALPQVSLALEGDRPWIAYTGSDDLLRLATRSGRRWAKELVSLVPAREPFLAIDGDANLHVLYQSNAGPRYRWRPESTWLAVPVGAADRKVAGLAIGPEDEPVVLLRDTVTHIDPGPSLPIAVCRRSPRSPGSFVCDDVGGTVGADDADLALRANGKAAVVFAIRTGDPTIPCTPALDCRAWHVREL